MMFPEMFNSGSGIYDPFATNPQAMSPMMMSDPFNVNPLGDPSMANMNVDPSMVDPQQNIGQMLGGGGGFDSNAFLKALGGLKAPAAPAVQAPPRAPDAPKAGTIPGGLQQLLAMLQGGGGRIPGLRL